MERLVTSDTVDWFPHLSPDGEFATYISFPTGTLGHPPISPSRSAWSGPRLEPTSCTLSRCSAARARSTSTAGRPTAAVRLRRLPAELRSPAAASYRSRQRAVVGRSSSAVARTWPSAGSTSPRRQRRKTKNGGTFSVSGTTRTPSRGIWATAVSVVTCSPTPAATRRRSSRCRATPARRSARTRPPGTARRTSDGAKNRTPRETRPWARRAGRRTPPQSHRPAGGRPERPPRRSRGRCCAADPGRGAANRAMARSVPLSTSSRTALVP